MHFFQWLEYRRRNDGADMGKHGNMSLYYEFGSMTQLGTTDEAPGRHYHKVPGLPALHLPAFESLLYPYVVLNQTNRV